MVSGKSDRVAQRSSRRRIHPIRNILNFVHFVLEHGSEMTMLVFVNVVQNERRPAAAGKCTEDELFDIMSSLSLLVSTLRLRHVIAMVLRARMAGVAPALGVGHV